MRFNDRAMALAGIPDLPFDAFKKEGGKIKLHGGGSGGWSQPTNTTQSTTTIPEYARPYVERMLGKAEAFSESPYQAYGGQRVADFSPMQQQAFQSAANLGPAQQLGDVYATSRYRGSWWSRCRSAVCTTSYKPLCDAVVHVAVYAERA